MNINKIHFSTIGSTNTWAKENVHNFEAGKITLVTADEQTAGRGRFKRRWESPANQNVYATFCFTWGKLGPEIGNIPQILAISAAEALEEMGFEPKLKWPNDIMLSDKKVSGILCETTTNDGTLWIIVGIGINVNMPLDLLQQIDRPATSLMVERGAAMDRQQVLDLLCQHFQHNLENFVKHGFAYFLENYKSRVSSLMGKQVRFHDNQTVWEGIFHSIKDDGSLNLQQASGAIKNFIAGEFV